MIYGENWLERERVLSLLRIYPEYPGSLDWSESWMSLHRMITKSSLPGLLRIL